MDIIHAIILGIVEGITEFLPISSTGHLTIIEKMLGYQIDSVGITAFTAVIQIGAILSAVVYFWNDIVKITTAWISGLLNKEKRNIDYKMGWFIVIGSIPIAIVGLLLKDIIESEFRSLWVVVAGLIVWSVVLVVADRINKEKRGESDITIKDIITMGTMQCFALVPGISRSGATISAGLFRGIDRTTATRMSFFLGIPALVAAGILEAITKSDDILETVGLMPSIVGMISSFLVGYISIAWLLKFVSRHNFNSFVVYRICLAIVIIVLLTSGIISAV